LVRGNGLLIADSARDIGRRPILVASLVLWTGSFLYLTLAPDLPKLGSVDANEYADWGHVVVTMGLAVILYLLAADSARWSRGRTAVTAIVAASAFGGAIELLQTISNTRDPSVSDAVLDAVGAAVAVGVLVLLPIQKAVVTAVVAVCAILFSAATAIAAVFFTPAPVGDRDCAASVVSHHAPSARARTVPSQRATRGLVALYVPGPESGSTVPNRSGAGSTELRLVEPGVTPVADGLRFSGGSARTRGSAAALIDPVLRSEALTVEAWVRSDDLEQNGPTRIVTISDGTERDQVDVHLGQERDALSVRLRASCGQFNWTTAEDVFVKRRRLEHLVLTYAHGVQRIYVQGRLVDATRFDGRLAGWDRRYPLVVGNEATRDRPFVGDVSLVAVYDRALSASEIAASAAAGVPES
jgi:VanZ family protein